MHRDANMKIFSGVPFSKSSSFNINNKQSIMCFECQRKFKEFLKNGGNKPIACIACQEKLKDQMFAGRYPDRG